MTHKRMIGWILGSIAALLVVVVVAGIFTLRSGGFHRYVLAKIVESTNEATGGRTEIKNFDFHWRNLSADVYGLVLHGTEKDPNRPLLALDKLSINLKIISALHRKVDLNEIVVQHPVIHLISDRDGRSNIPQPKPKKESAPVNVFDLGIKHVLLTNGEIYYNQERSPIEAELHDLQTEIQYEIFLRNVVVEGRLDSRELDLLLPQAHAAVRAIHGQYKLANGNLAASDIGADLLGGHLSAELTMQHMDTTPVSRLRASVRAISLRSIREVANSGDLKRVPVTGRIDGGADASWTGSMTSLKAK